jgi:hypothetical protein
MAVVPSSRLDHNPESHGVLCTWTSHTGLTPEFAQQWFDNTVLALVKERESKFYELMTTAFRNELQRQVRQL